MEIYERLKKIRNDAGLKQAEFAKKIGIGHSTLGMMEIGKREIKPRYIKTICSMFNVNEEWFCTGNGDIYIQTDNDLLEKLSDKYHLSSLQKKMLTIFISMDDDKREILSEAFFSFADTVNALSKKEQSKSVNLAIKSDSELSRENKHKLLDEELDAVERGKTFTVSIGTNGILKR